MSRLIASLAFVLILQGALGDLVCEELPVGMCSFSISSSGRRCVLETLQSDGGDREFQCTTSEVTATNMPAYIESDECMSACGLSRNSVGISSDSLLEVQFTRKLCSPQCYYTCPNIVDLYQNLALAEGVFLSDLCKSQTTSSRRSVIQLQSSSEAAPAPVSEGPTSAAAYGPASSATLSSVDCAPSPL
ncbi:PAR1 protein [Perilla frutescens var. frutescens]|nr:PAR1 protein [Perilla frutescens var. frutescens]